MLTLTLCLPLKKHFLSRIKLYLYINTVQLIPRETIIRKAWKGGKPNRNNITYKVSEIYTKQSIKEENSSLFMNNIL